jgi:hypothetical protein
MCLPGVGSIKVNALISTISVTPGGPKTHNAKKTYINVERTAESGLLRIAHLFFAGNPVLRLPTLRFSW